MGYIRDFDGHTEAFPIGARRDERDAQKLGAEWVDDRNIFYKSEKRKLHASYQIHSCILR